MLVSVGNEEGGKEEEHKHTAELVDVIIRCFFGKGRVGLVDGFRYVAYIGIYIWYVTYPLLIFEGMMMMMILLLTITCRICM